MNGAGYEEREFKGRDCSVTLRKYGYNILLFRVCGHLSVDKARFLIEEAQRVVAKVGTVHAFHDWEDVTDYELASRLELTKYLVVNRKSFKSVDLLVNSKDVEFGVEVANIVLKYKINVHKERRTFEDSFNRLLEQ